MLRFTSLPLTSMDTRLSVMVAAVEPCTVFKAALTVTCPAATGVRRPELLMVATLAVETPHLTLVVRSFELPSLYEPVALNCCVAPAEMTALPGVTEIEVRDGVVVGGWFVVKLPPPQATKFNVKSMAKDHNAIRKRMSAKLLDQNVWGVTTGEVILVPLFLSNPKGGTF